MLNRLNLTAEKPNICEPVKTSAKRILAHFLLIKKHMLINALLKTRNIGFYGRSRFAFQHKPLNSIWLWRRSIQLSALNYCVTIWQSGIGKRHQGVPNNMISNKLKVERRPNRHKSVRISFYFQNPKNAQWRLSQPSIKPTARFQTWTGAITNRIT
jgi:hypothetical protein